MKAVAGTSNGFIAGLRDPSGNLMRLHCSFMYGGDASTSTTDVYAHADKLSDTVSLYADFFNKLSLGVWH
jgi:hypothetical protein